MESMEIMRRIDVLDQEIATLPSGHITTKKINGKIYFYHRTNQNKKRTETYLDFDQVDNLRKQIEKRKALESERKKLKLSLPISKKAKQSEHTFHTYVRIGEPLKRLTLSVKDYKKRECYQKLHDYIYSDAQDKVFILYGLRRTGKTTLIRQILYHMDASFFSKAAFIQIKAKDSLSDINSDLAYLEQCGYRYVFIDEVTLMEDFIEGAALFSDIYAGSGMKIVLSGTDSLGFLLSEEEQLYDRCITLHTTWIPYREFERVLGMKGIDEYIRYGGTMSISGINYHENSSFSNQINTNEYIDSAIAKNIQHSLTYYQDGGHFRHLFDLYEKKELTSAINRVVEDINHRFTKETLTRSFRSSDLAISARNLLHDRKKPVDILKHMDKDAVNAYVMQMLDILNKEEQSIEIDETHAYQIKEYLILLDLIVEVDLFHFPGINQQDKITIVTQPGMRYAQADALIESLLHDEKFNLLSVYERKEIMDRIRSEIKGRMMEHIVLLETKLAYPHKDVFQLQFAMGEFDMVVCHPETLSCEIYEIKYSKEIVPAQYRHLKQPERCDETEHRFGKIIGKYVIYRGETTMVEGIQYLNVEEYLTSLV